MKKRWKVFSYSDPISVRFFLKEKLGSTYSVRKIKWAIDHGMVQVNGVVERHSTRKLAASDEVSIDPSSLDSTSSTHHMFERTRVLYGDDHILLYNKPPFISTMDVGVYELLQQHYETLFPVHRLDKLTSGVLLFARDEDTARVLSQQFRERTVKKVYRALVDGIPQHDGGVIDMPVVKGKREQRAETSWKVCATYGDRSLVECSPQTGRRHQIRIHMQSIGHPVLGDYHYARTFTSDYRPLRQLLHAYSMTFLHPITEKKLTVVAPIPDDFAEAQR